MKLCCDRDRKRVSIFDFFASEAPVPVGSEGNKVKPIAQDANSTHTR